MVVLEGPCGWWTQKCRGQGGGGSVVRDQLVEKNRFTGSFFPGGFTRVKFQAWGFFKGGVGPSMVCRCSDAAEISREMQGGAGPAK